MTTINKGFQPIGNGDVPKPVDMKTSVRPAPSENINTVADLSNFMVIADKYDGEFIGLYRNPNKIDFRELPVYSYDKYKGWRNYEQKELTPRGIKEADVPIWWMK